MFAVQFGNRVTLRTNRNGFVAQLDRAPDYGSGGLGFESLRDHLKIKHLAEMLSAFLLYVHNNVHNIAFLFYSSFKCGGVSRILGIRDDCGNYSSS
jgi:hypothetical protein